MVRFQIMALLALGGVCGCGWLRSVDANTRLATTVAREFGARQGRIYVDRGNDLVIELAFSRLDTSEPAKGKLAGQIAVFLRDRDSVYDTTRGIDVTLFKYEWIYSRFITSRWFPRDSLGPRQDTASVVRED